MKDNGKIRAFVFDREQDICRCCRLRRADSMHELRFRSLGGKVSKRNSVAVCGSGTTGCHGFLQSWQISWVGDAPPSYSGRLDARRGRSVGRFHARWAE